MGKTLCTINGKSFYHTGARTEFFELAASGKWEPETFKVFDKHIESGKHFIDIGAWNGICSLYAAAMGAHVTALEPDPKAYIEFLDNIAMNNFIIHSIKEAISNKLGMVSMYTQTKDGFGNSETSLLQRGSTERTHEVFTKTLEQFIEETGYDINNICLIKMDIEGGEVLALPPMKHFFEQFKPKMYISFHPAWFPEIDKNIQEIIDTMFHVYEVSDHNDNMYSPDEFKYALVNNIQHSFLFTAK